MVLGVTLDSVPRKTKTKGEISYVEKPNNKKYPCPDIPNSSNIPQNCSTDSFLSTKTQLTLS